MNDDKIQLSIDGDPVVSLASILASNNDPNVSPLDDDEIALLRRLRVGETCRLACGGGSFPVTRWL